MQIVSLSLAPSAGGDFQWNFPPHQRWMRLSWKKDLSLSLFPEDETRNNFERNRWPEIKTKGDPKSHPWGRHYAATLAFRQLEWETETAAVCMRGKTRGDWVIWMSLHLNGLWGAILYPCVRSRKKNINCDRLKLPLILSEWISVDSFAIKTLRSIIVIDPQPHNNSFLQRSHESA